MMLIINIEQIIANSKNFKSGITGKTPKWSPASRKTCETRGNPAGSRWIRTENSEFERVQDSYD
jgi:hypothetical protein